jgi:epoxyqueuosine reductase QueG
MSLEQELKDRMLDLGADFVGIASRSRFEHAPDFSDPRKLLPEFRSVVAFGVTMSRGSLDVWFSKRNRRPLVLNLVTENAKLEKYRIPEEEIKGLMKDFEPDCDASGYAASAAADSE